MGKYPKAKKPEMAYQEKAKGALPEIGHTYEDINGRLLTVEAVNMREKGEKKRSQVLGKVQKPHGPSVHPPAPYGCDLKTWREIWHEKMPEGDPSKMKIG